MVRPIAMQGSRQFVAFPPAAARVCPWLQRVAIRIAADPAEACGLTELSRAANCSPEHLIRSFRRCYGVSPHQFRLSRRVLLAASLLSQGRKVADAAVTAGFSDQSHLCRHFRRSFGCSPSQYARTENSGAAGRAGPPRFP